MQYDAFLARLDHVRKSGLSHSAQCPAHEDRTNSFSVTLRDGKIWVCCHKDCSFGDILAALGIRAADLFTDERARIQDPKARIRWAREKFWQGSHLIKDSAVEEYLRRCRHITIDPLPPSIRGALVPHREYGWPFPAMVAGLQDGNGDFAGVSVTWVSNDGTDKAPVEPTRKIFGILSGAAVRLAAAGPTLAISEGIETGLAFQQGTQIPTWAGLTAYNLPKIILPEIAQTVIIAGDNDETGRKHARRAAIAFRQSGRTVRFCFPNGRKDFAE